MLASCTIAHRVRLQQPPTHPPARARAPRRYPHPKQVLVADGVLSPDMATYLGSNSRRRPPPGAARYGGGGVNGSGGRVDENGTPAAQLAFPHGATLLVQEPAVAVLSTGTLAHPYDMPAGGRGWVAVGWGLGDWCFNDGAAEQKSTAKYRQSLLGITTGHTNLTLRCQRSMQAANPTWPRCRRSVVAGGRGAGGSSRIGAHV